ncbi:MAG TPA: hypothetical protein VNR86_09225, partial [Sphingomicrobium sp.]|nr:hypothetical protein [Sphingomicrobium sp.]
MTIFTPTHALGARSHARPRSLSNLLLLVAFWRAAGAASAAGAANAAAATSTARSSVVWRRGLVMRKRP